jgi:hypothetical protein
MSSAYDITPIVVGAFYRINRRGERRNSMLDSRAVGQIRPEAESPSEKAHECMVSQEGLSVRGRFKRQPHVKLCAIRTRAEVDFSVMPLTTILWLITRPSPVPETC